MFSLIIIFAERQEGICSSLDVYPSYFPYAIEDHLTHSTSTGSEVCETSSLLEYALSKVNASSRPSEPSEGSSLCDHTLSQAQEANNAYEKSSLLEYVLAKSGVKNKVVISSP